MSASLFPKPLVIERSASGSSVTAASLSANLMPFTIGYDGPAPISRYMLLRPAPATGDEAAASSTQQATAEAASGLLESTFRGRVIHGTPIALPPGYEALLVTLPTEADELTALGGKGATQDEEGEGSRKRSKAQRQEAEPDEAENSGLRRSPRKKAPPPPPKPAFMPSFSMDDDDEDEDEEAQDEQEPEAPMEWNMASPEPEQGDKGSSDGALEEAVRIGKVVGSFGSSIMLWNPDGPIDEGDDPYVRTLREWMGVVGKAIHDE